MDLDAFKSINDIYGHRIGDKVIRQVGELFAKNVRESDLAGRYGGEEFVILLSDTNGTAAYQYAERLRQKVMHELIVKHGRERIPITVSIGVTEWNGEESLERVLARADHAMYRAKHDGRNRVCV